MSTAYNIPPVVLNPSTPEWAKIVINNMQASRDAEYRKALDEYYGRAQVWIDDNVFKRNNAPDPSKYVPTFFDVHPPAREVTDWGGAGFVFTYVVDPNVVPPVLPPYVEPAKNTGFTTGAPADAAANLGFQAATITILSAMGKDIAAIKAKLGIQ